MIAISAERLHMSKINVGCYQRQMVTSEKIWFGNVLKEDRLVGNRSGRFWLDCPEDTFQHVLPENIYVRCDVDKNLPKCRKTLSFVNVWFVCFISIIAVLEFNLFFVQVFLNIL